TLTATVPAAEFAIALEPELAIEGRVVDWDDKPIPWPIVFADPVDGQAQSAQASRGGADGRFRIPHLQPGRYRVLANLPQGNAVADGVAAGTRDLVLRPGGEIAGRLLGPDGSSIGGAEVVAAAFGPNVRGATALTDADGRFRIRGLVGKSFRVHAKVPGYAMPFLEEIPLGKQDLEIQVEEGLSISGRIFVKGRTAPKVEKVKVVVFTEGRTGRARIEEDGSFRIRGLKPGTYKIRVTAEGGWKASKESVPAGSHGHVIELSR
ncbi:MAG: carboxypeptidase-like regulatory domain-containing protein, partial [SAR324 cluster bacterium]|nr:carboxypeptidase-like regulatory domain-containing protein [SAR324 cluster bacterium]